MLMPRWRSVTAEGRHDTGSVKMRGFPFCMATGRFEDYLATEVV